MGGGDKEKFHYITGFQKMEKNAFKVNKSMCYINVALLDDSKNDNGNKIIATSIELLLYARRS